MRITDDRYERERAHHDLALRMIAHEARTCTIRAFTGLTDDRIRKLYRSYVVSRTVRRRRGKSPRQTEFFTRNLAALLESSCLGSLLFAHDVIGLRAAGRLQPSLDLGARFCDAYEAYLRVLKGSVLSFEHAWCLSQLLAEGRELILKECLQCGGQHIADPIIRRKYGCPHCKIRATPLEHIPSVKELLSI